MSDNLPELYNLLGYHFKDDKLIHAALSHRSCGADNNERLEFLGDALLGAIIAEELYNRYAELDEGKLSRIRASLVNKKSLAAIGAKLKLADFVKLGVGERVAGKTRPSILSDALEAIIAALFLDAGFTKCKQCLLSWFGDLLVVVEDETAFKDPKSRLQEYLQKNTLSLAEYKIIDMAGPEHQQEFTVSCTQSNLEITATGIGPSKQQAEKDAAANLLKQLKNKTKK